MKPTDFFVGSRQFFGFLIPGVVWLGSILLILVNTPLRELLTYAAAANWIGALSFLALAFVIGILTQDRSFGFSRSVSRRLTEYERRNDKQRHSLRIRGKITHADEADQNAAAVSAESLPADGIGETYRLGTNQKQNEIKHGARSRGSKPNCMRRWLLSERLAPRRYRAALSREVADLLRRRFTGVRVPPRLYFDPADRHYQGERQIFTICKRSMLSRSPELGRLLREKEDEINLVGMLPLPLAFLVVGLLMHVSDIRKLPVRGGPACWAIGLIIFGAAVIIHLLFRFHRLRKEEFRMCLESFLLVESGLAEGLAASGDQREQK
jgi:hypothetical protein